ncbi:Outer membrane protein TolC [Chryseolinea serpens]|uniref:Outer membrane protein TolC n=1 Tax=Chryseolinea serpens TaxID=947013 RepID=A0A1M5JKP5_9BACT|nr:TolC family protein [Chryseolinea serpens]SHG41098.1 Outer membrane protein TolC [Chryseolinea serpens]
MTTISTLRSLVTAALLLASLAGQAQSLTLDECYAMAEQNYPLIQQRELIGKSKEYSLSNASKGYLPQLAINGQATYQSDVTRIPFDTPGSRAPLISKDQYKIYGEATQALYDGGVIREQQANLEVNAKIDEQKLEVELYKLKDRVNQLFFGALMIGEQLKQNDLLIQDLQNGIAKTDAAVANGTALKSSLNVLKAELLKARQRAVELNATRVAYTDMLGLFMNRSLGDSAVLVKPAAPVVEQEIRRPEMQLYAYQDQSTEVQYKMLAARNRPKLSLFLQSGFGRPALNMLDNTLKGYYLGGIRLNWSLAGLYTNKGDRALIDLNKRNIDVQRRTFLFNTNMTLQQQNREAAKYQQLLASDDEIIALRVSVKNAASAQLENGVIDTNDYLREVNAQDQAQQNKILHEIQFLLAQYNQKTTTGN